MQSDELVWSIINKGQCSFKAKTETQSFCRNEYNLTGICSRSSCPLANSNYATVLEKEGTLFLYVKTAERSHTPALMWERTKLPQNYEKALGLIDTQLEFWPKFIVHKCKQRLTKLTQMLIRMRRLAVKVRSKLVGIHKKTEVRERARERKALNAAMIERAIEKELLERLQKGVYPDSDEILNASKGAFNKALDSKGAVADEDEELDDSDVDEELDDADDDDVGVTEYVADFDEDELASDLEDSAPADPSIFSKLMSRKRSAGGDDGAGSSDEGARPKKRRRHVEVELEDDVVADREAETEVVAAASRGPRRASFGSARRK
eukprot:Amastigsp_a508542_680.p1 type:complete len:321 gc:universal Amastigsp_a508542_680:1078-116(-)